MTQIEQKRQANAVKEMVQTAGWDIIEKELTVQAEQKMAELVSCKDREAIPYLQGEILGIRLLLEKVHFYLSIK